MVDTGSSGSDTGGSGGGGEEEVIINDCEPEQVDPIIQPTICPPNADHTYLLISLTSIL